MSSFAGTEIDEQQQDLYNMVIDDAVSLYGSESGADLDLDWDYVSEDLQEKWSVSTPVNELAQNNYVQIAAEQNGFSSFDEFAQKVGLHDVEKQDTVDLDGIGFGTEATQSTTSADFDITD